MQEEISLKDLYLIVKKHLFTLFTLTLVGAIVSLGYMNFFVEPTYKSEAQLLVNQKQADQPTINYSEIQSNIQLINTYRDLIKSQQLLTQVSENTGGLYSPAELKSAITVDQATNSQIFNVRIVLDDPTNAQTVLAEITRVFDQTLRSIYDAEVSNIYVVQAATFEQSPVSPSTVRYLLIGALLGAAVSGVYVLIKEMLDTSVKDEKFLQDLGLTKLGEINSLTTKETKQARLPQRDGRRGKE